jgi:hypothetical protein
MSGLIISSTGLCLGTAGLSFIPGLGSPGGEDILLNFIFFRGNGSLTLTTIHRGFSSASFSGAGALNVVATQSYPIPASFQGAGGFSVATTQNWQCAAGFAGAGGKP